MHPNLERFGQVVRERRAALDRSQLDVWRAGGPSNSTMTKIENGEPPAPSSATLRKLDAGLLWEKGSARATLDGGEPVPLAGPAGPVRPPKQELGSAEALAEFLHSRTVQVRRSVENRDDALEVADNMLTISNGIWRGLDAVEAAIEIDAPTDDVRYAIEGLLALYIGSGAMQTLQAARPERPPEDDDLLRRLARLRSVAISRDRRPGVIAALFDSTREDQTNDTPPMNQAGVSPADDLTPHADPGEPIELPETEASEQEQPPTRRGRGRRG